MRPSWSFILLTLTLTVTASHLPAAPFPQKRQTTITGGWALRTSTCPSNFQSCKSQASFPGQDACCPTSTTCVANSLTGDVMCCPIGDTECGGEISRPYPAPLCADPSWSLWTSAYPEMFFCCAQDLQGYWNRETYGFGEQCLAAGVTTETAGGADTLAAVTATSSTYTFKRTSVTAATTPAATTSAASAAAASATASTSATVTTQGAKTRTSTAATTTSGTASNGNGNSNTNINQITISASSPLAGSRVGYVISAMAVGVVMCFMFF